MFKELRLVENVEARNDALSTAWAIDTAEQAYKCLQMQDDGQIVIRGMFKQSEWIADFDALSMVTSGASMKRSKNSVIVG